MPIRNPFARRPGLVIPIPQDENVRPGSASADVAHPGFERVDTIGSKASSGLSIRSTKSQDTGEYKMSVVNDSGVYLPPSPTEKEATWPRRYLSRTSTDTRSSSGEIEHFSISRESFDSYRRSFDISARSPIVNPDPAPRQSLDSTRFPRLPRSALAERRFEREPPTVGEEALFEDVGLSDDHNGKHHVFTVKKRGFFSKFGSDSNNNANTNHHHNRNHDSPSSSAVTITQTQTIAARFLPGRKRGHSGQGAELGVMPVVDRPKTATSVVESAEVPS